ncbi:hypothetical protein MIDIC_110034 [Alphaproteobacteria bacterium]
MFRQLLFSCHVVMLEHGESVEAAMPWEFVALNALLKNF